jgi:hypothetical protein
MFTVQVLICALGILGGDCTPNTATDYWYAEPAPSPAVCLQYGQFSAAQYPERLLEGHYTKVRCLRSRPADLA